MCWNLPSPSTLSAHIQFLEILNVLLGVMAAVPAAVPAQNTLQQWHHPQEFQRTGRTSGLAAAWNLALVGTWLQEEKEKIILDWKLKWY